MMKINSNSKKIVLFFGFSLTMILFVSCSSKSKESPNIETARQEAIESAKTLIKNRNAKLLEVQGYILDAKAEQSKYTLMGDTTAAREYDLAFKKYIEENNDSLAKILF